MKRDEKKKADRANGNRGEGYDGPVDLLAIELMTAAKHGDSAAFDRLAERVRGRAFRVAHSLVGSTEDARELTQEAFLKTYRARETYRDGEPFLPWFHRILRNTCFSFLRKHKRLKKHSLSGEKDGEEFEWEIESRDPSPTERPERDEVHAAFHEAFERLSARDREILSLRHFDDLSYREIAHALGIPEGTVMSRLFHARRRLRDALAPYLSGALSEFREPARPANPRSPS
ncbi:MAG TPA: RNA polymerase sigma factor [Planctomycetes bacterium]|nr:RNA polymerase sigma factor [Planctomycetota bacterium]